MNFAIWVLSASMLILGANLGFMLGTVWTSRWLAKLYKGQANMNVRLAIISRRLGNWIQRQPTEKLEAQKTDEIMPDEAPTKKE